NHVGRDPKLAGERAADPSRDRADGVAIPAEVGGEARAARRVTVRGNGEAKGRGYRFGRRDTRADELVDFVEEGVVVMGATRELNRELGPSNDRRCDHRTSVLTSQT